MLVITRKTNEGIIISDNIEITVLEINKDRVKIGISAPKEVRIIRNEILQTEEINRQASEVPSKQAIDRLLKKQ
jgi:carbon storage regulator